MKKLNKILIGVSSVFLLLFLASPIITQAAATAPTLGAMESFSVLAKDSMAANGAGTTVSGAMGLSTGLAVSRTGVWLPLLGRTEYFGPGSLADTAQIAATAAKISMAAEPSDGAWGPIALSPGVYTAAGNPVFAGTLTLTGNATDVWVFQLTSDFTFTGDVVLAGGARACNVFWQIGQDATINKGGPGSKFVGTLIAGRDVSLVGGVTVDGRIISGRSFTGAGGDSISGPTCATEAPPSEEGLGSRVGTINVVKVVINDSGGTKTVADFPLFVNGTPVVSGITNTFPAPAPVYTVTETSDSHYAQTFSGDCDINGQLNLSPGFNKFCIITNNDIGTPVNPSVPPLIDVVKVPNPLALPSGPGLVQYTYTARNIGTVPMSNVTMVGDSCSPIILVSGDTNNDAKLDVNETWIYRCSTTLSKTHTNTVVATGWANGLSAVDIASATVVVGVPVIPPLIHITKVPSPLSLLAGGGMVTYTNRITNPGIVALSNVRVTDDKCSSINYISGDINNNLKLDTTETWVYTCKQKLTKTTTNTAVATGEANGLTARDFAIATVVVANAVPVVPTLPDTGIAPEGSTPWNMVIPVSIFMLVSVSLLLILKKSKI
ncbi:MAG: ice-binding family protein [Patescibacteria group bacterium]|jgi:uncharacterized repeat protein (TIGR01451 family)